MIDQFIIFLVQNRALDKFKNNLSNDGQFTTEGFDEYILDAEDPEDYILLAFDWELSWQGDAYWADLSDSWRKRVLKFI